MRGGRLTLELPTDRLLLVACPPDVAEALCSDRGEAERLLDATLPAGWPDAELAELLPLYAKRLREDPHVLGYGTWLVVERDGRTVVGSAGFLNRPTSEGAIEIGYGILPDHRGRGYATEAARALVAWARGRDEVVRVVARCRPANAASIRVLTKAGLTQTGEVDGLIRWETG